MFKNIKTRLLVWYSLTLFLILVGFSFTILETFAMQNIKTVDAKLKAVAYDIEHDLDEYIHGNSEGFDEEEEFFINNLNISIFKKESSKISIIEKSSANLEIFDFKREYKTLFEELENSIRVLTYQSKKDKNIFIQVSTTLYDKVHPALHSLKNTILIVVPLVFLFAIFIGFIIIRKAFKPVKKIIDEVNSINTNDLEKRINSLNSNDELDELILTFNGMLSRIEESFSKIKRFSNDVSHELKTPLTVIRGELELGLRKDRTLEEYKAILTTVLEESISLQELIDSLLFLSNSNKDEIVNNFNSVQFDELLIDVIKDNNSLLKEKNISLEIKELNQTTVEGHNVLLKVLLNNLLQNAIKYSNENFNIEITLKDNSLEIKDYGIGIKDEDLEHIFDRFYMVDKSRSKKGYGLGLSIVKLIVNIHSFKIKVNSKYKEYSSFKIVF